MKNLASLLVVISLALSAPCSYAADLSTDDSVEKPSSIPVEQFQESEKTAYELIELKNSLIKSSVPDDSTTEILPDMIDTTITEKIYGDDGYLKEVKFSDGSTLSISYEKMTEAQLIDLSKSFGDSASDQLIGAATLSYLNRDGSVRVSQTVELADLKNQLPKPTTVIDQNLQAASALRRQRENSKFDIQIKNKVSPKRFQSLLSGLEEPLASSAAQDNPFSNEKKLSTFLESIASLEAHLFDPLTADLETTVEKDVHILNDALYDWLALDGARSVSRSQDGYTEIVIYIS